MLANFRYADCKIATRQHVNAQAPYFCPWYLMIRSIQLNCPYNLTLALALPAAAFWVRLFVRFHDGVPRSLFKSKHANTFLGYLLGVIAVTAFADWLCSHLRHHVMYANLDASGSGDIWTMTRAEYEAASTANRLMYRL